MTQVATQDDCRNCNGTGISRSVRATTNPDGTITREEHAVPCYCWGTGTSPRTPAEEHPAGSFAHEADR